ncbi:hypothetical protein HZC21_01760 [Candidatus Peregrinibacteria bacterium]|nr:hypothetical protein [Candidatus Peregrinibacteria bacterium]
MKNPTKITIGIVIAIVIIVGAVFATNTDLFKGSLEGANKNITKGQLAVLIVTTLIPVIGQDVINNPKEECVSAIATTEEKTSICYLIGEGMLPYGYAEPDVIPSRGAAAVIFNKAFNQYLPPVSTTEKVTRPYSDVFESAFFGPAVNNLAAHGVLDIKSGQNNKFFPNNALTVGRAKYWIKKIQEKSEVL